MDDATVRDVLGDAVNDPTDAGTVLHGTADLLGCQWATPVGTALTVTVTRLPNDHPAGSAADWSRACRTPLQPLEIEDARGGICLDTAFGVTGSELYAVWSDDEMVMRLGVQRESGPQPEDAARLRQVAVDLTSGLTPAEFDEAESQ